MQKISISLLLLLFLGVTESFAQSKVTFNVNMKRMLVDSTFVPGQDQLKLSGNLYPLGRGRELLLEDTTPKDSIYSVEVSFPSRYDEEQLSFNFFIVTPEKVMREIQPRIIILQGKDMELYPIPFNAFSR